MVEGNTTVYMVVKTFEGYDPVQAEDHEPNVVDTLMRKIYYTREAANDAVRAYSQVGTGCSFEFEHYSVVAVDLPFALERTLRHGLAFVFEQSGLELEHVMTYGSLHGYRLKTPKPQS